MSTRFEDDLRAAMVGATPPPLTLDPEAVLRQGKQTVRARRVARASIVGLVAIAVAAFGLAGSHRDEVHPRPATPAPTPTLSTPSAPTGPVPVTLRLGSETYQVEVDLSAIAEGSGTTVTVFRGDGAQRVELFGWGTGQRPMLNPAEDGRRDVREVIGAGPTGYSRPPTVLLPWLPHDLAGRAGPGAGHRFHRLRDPLRLAGRPQARDRLRLHQPRRDHPDQRRTER